MLDLKYKCNRVIKKKKKLFIDQLETTSTMMVVFSLISPIFKCL